MSPFYVSVLLTLLIGGDPLTRWMESDRVFTTLAECQQQMTAHLSELHESVAKQFAGQEYAVQEFACLTLGEVTRRNATLAEQMGT